MMDTGTTIAKLIFLKKINIHSLWEVHGLPEMP